MKRELKFGNVQNQKIETSNKLKINEEERSYKYYQELAKKVINSDFQEKFINVYQGINMMAE